jgi:hypothetical protein
MLDFVAQILQVARYTLAILPSMCHARTVDELSSYHYLHQAVLNQSNAVVAGQGSLGLRSPHGCLSVPCSLQGLSVAPPAGLSYLPCPTPLSKQR